MLRKTINSVPTPRLKMERPARKKQKSRRHPQASASFEAREWKTVSLRLRKEAREAREREAREFREKEAQEPERPESPSVEELFGIETEEQTEKTTGDHWPTPWNVLSADEKQTVLKILPDFQQDSDPVRQLLTKIGSLQRDAYMLTAVMNSMNEAWLKTSEDGACNCESGL